MLLLLEERKLDSALAPTSSAENRCGASPTGHARKGARGQVSVWAWMESSGGGLEVPGLSEPPRRKAASSHPETQADLLEQMEQFTLSFKAGIDLGFGPRGGSRTRPFLVGTAVVAEVGDPGMNC